MLDLSSRAKLLDIQIAEAEAAGRFKVQPEERAVAIPPTVAEAMAGFDRILELIAKKSAAFEAEMDAAPQWMPCQFHGNGPPALLNREASMGTAKMVYTCHLCEEERRSARFQKRIISAGIPADVRHATLDNFHLDRQNVRTGEGLVSPQKFLDRAAKFAAGEIRNLILAGTPGIGKGHLAAAIAIPAIMAGKSVIWIDAAQLFRDYHQAYKDNTNEHVLTRHAKAHLLVLDEVAFKGPTETKDKPSDGEEVLFNIFDRRQKQGLQSVLLSNQPAVTIKTWLGSRICDRLRSGGVSLCYGEWDSMRGKAQDGAQEDF